MITKTNSIDDYIAGFPPATQKLLQQLRMTIRKAAPKAEETISYGIPTLKLNGNLVHFGGFKNHIGFFPSALGIEAFKKELSSYKSSKGTVQFPLDKPLPLDLVTRMVKFRILQNEEKTASKKNSKGLNNLKPQENFLAMLSAPARRALESRQITTLKKLSAFSETEILKLHGVGPSSLPKLKNALKNEGLSFKS
jgi:uncharacterized protein YdhG (YjbR/CyaY superfamily)